MKDTIRISATLAIKNAILLKPTSFCSIIFSLIPIDPTTVLLLKAKNRLEKDSVGNMLHSE